MSDDFKIQVSFKVPVSNDNYRDSMINVRADDAQELGELLEAVVLNASAIEEARAAVVGAVVITSGLGGRVESTGPAAQADAANAAGTSIEGPDRFGRTYVHGDPAAPDVPEGPNAGKKAVKMKAVSREGKAYEKWLDPGSKDIPSVYASGVKSNPPGTWAGKYVN